MHVFAAGYVMFVNIVAINVSTFVVFKYENAYKLIKHEVEITKDKQHLQQFVLFFNNLRYNRFAVWRMCCPFSPHACASFPTDKALYIYLYQ